MASTVSNGNDRSQKWQRPFTKGKFATGIYRGPGKRARKACEESGRKLTTFRLLYPEEGSALPPETTTPPRTEIPIDQGRKTMIC